jgi:hypothetical protein
MKTIDTDYLKCNILNPQNEPTRFVCEAEFDGHRSEQYCSNCVFNDNGCLALQWAYDWSKIKAYHFGKNKLTLEDLEPFKNKLR